MSIGARIKEIRISKRLSQKETALKTGISRALLAQIEGDKTKPNLEFLRQFVSYTNTSYSYILEGKEELTTDAFFKEVEEIYNSINTISVRLANLIKKVK